MAGAASGRESNKQRKAAEFYVDSMAGSSEVSSPLTANTTLKDLRRFPSGMILRGNYQTSFCTLGSEQ